MTVFQAIVLGIIQGLSEFLPISSSAHLTLTPWLLGWEDPGLDVDVALHLGTLIALVWYFWQEWMLMLRAAVMIVVNRRIENESERRLVWVVVATIPGAAAGFFLREQAATIFRSPTLIACALIGMGVVLWLVDRAADKSRGITEMKLSDAILIGLAQMLAIVPGVSRSGSTITAGRALKFSREGAAVFSFLMSLPITLAAVIVETPKAIAQHGLTMALVAGVVASAVSGWLAISVLLKFVARHSYGVFAAYRLILGAIVLLLVWQRG
jgi:undecaprenyl-diphosphatase